MKHLSEFRNPDLAGRLLAAIRGITSRPWTIMEVCGGQTHAILRYGIDELLPPQLELVHGPGCPVCVTSQEVIDHAISIAARPGVIFCSFGDMLRVPGTETDLLRVKSEGADVRIVHSPLDAVRIAQNNPQNEVVFFGIGFETTAPANGFAVQAAARNGVRNFSLLSSQVRVPPALEAIVRSPGNRVQAFLAAGHVCTVMGCTEYPSLAERWRVPIIITGFEPLDILDGIRRAVMQLEAGRHEMENAYERVAAFEGNPHARAIIEDVFEDTDATWRGIGVIRRSGWKPREYYRAFDASHRFPFLKPLRASLTMCRSGDVLQGRLKPTDCPHFGTDCSPHTPLGATMVSDEGACAAYHRAGRLTSLPAVSHVVT